ncbi:MAG: aminotransferase [Hyphomicrobiales bacterium]|nr:MAG: aminotransferase [Hyphomicrobiales bacterium]
MPRQAGRAFLHTPGPTHIPDSVLNAMHRQSMDLGDPKFSNACDDIVARLKPLFGTDGDVYIYAANGHGGWEAILTNVFSPGDKILLIETGFFSEDWRDHAREIGLDVETISADWRSGVDPQLIADHLARDVDREIKAVLLTHVDTAAGLVTEIAPVREAIDSCNHPALLLVDGVASIGTMPFHMDNMGVDIAITATQKALMGPPGIALIGVGKQLHSHNREGGYPRRYWDWRKRNGPSNYAQFGGTGPLQTLFALQQALVLMEAEGFDNIFSRHARIANAVHAAVEIWAGSGDLQFNVPNRIERAPAVTTILTPEGYDSEKLRGHLRSSLSVSVGGGLGKLFGKAFRIGHMGDMNEPMILGCLCSVEMALNECGLAHGKGGVTAAIESFYQSRNKVL